MPYTILTERTIQRRRHWIDELAQISGRFGEDTARVERELIAEIQREGPAALLDHLHLCGAIPEEYGHDTSEEKLYSKSLVSGYKSNRINWLSISSKSVSELGA
jgi:hypothetical protein